MRGTTDDKLAEICQLEDCEDLIELIDNGLEDTAICMNVDCDYIETMEPDQTEGWCPECNENSMVAAMILGGLI